MAELNLEAAAVGTAIGFGIDLLNYATGSANEGKDARFDLVHSVPSPFFLLARIYRVAAMEV